MLVLFIVDNINLSNEMEFINMEKYKIYTEMLKSELIVAMGCTEPIALSLAACKLKEVLGDEPELMEAFICGNIIKNAKSVIVPNTNGLFGIEASLASGLVANNSKLELEILSKLNQNDVHNIKRILNENKIKVKLANNCKTLYIQLIGYYKNNRVEIIIEDFHNNITFIKKNENILYAKEDLFEKKQQEYNLLTVGKIIDFANNCSLEELRPYLMRQIKYNYAIALEGLTGKYGASIGKILLEKANSTQERAKAFTAAASDARMAGCDMPVVIISGSGNQGITTSVPLVVYAKEYNIPEEKLLRSLIVSDLVALEEKKDIGRLSAFCGAISAGAAALAGITYMLGGDEEKVSHTIVNALAISSGIICDGAKSSCAGKIVLALEAGIIGYDMYLNNKEFKAGEGIIKKGVDNTIKNVGRLASFGMKETDKEILKMMIEE